MSAPHPSGRGTPGLSVVIPSYNSAEWLPSTLEALAAAVGRAAVDVEVIVVDDGSTDSTTTVVSELTSSFPGELRLISQENRGRFLARWEGLSVARGDWTLLLDSRALLGPESLSYVLAQIQAGAPHVAWNAHTVTDPAAPLVGLFWDVPVYVFWARYLRAPRPFDLTPATFDHAPKGTTIFLAKTGLLREAFENSWPEGDARLVSDDTKILRWIADTTPIRLDPGFAGVYRPRTNLRAFVRHSLDRGTLFVDSYAGTSVTRSLALVGLVLAPVAVLAALAVLIRKGHGLAAGAATAGLVGVAASPSVIARRNNCPPRSVLAYLVHLPVFVIPFWCGLLRGLAVHRKAFAHLSGTAAPRKEHP